MFLFVSSTTRMFEIYLEAARFVGNKVDKKSANNDRKITSLIVENGVIYS